MEQAPVTDMSPEIKDNGNAKTLNNNIYILSKPGEYYLAYVADSGQNVEINLTGDSGYKLDIIDTWNMKVGKQANVEPGEFKYVTVEPYTALRFIRKKP